MRNGKTLKVMKADKTKVSKWLFSMAFVKSPILKAEFTKTDSISFGVIFKIRPFWSIS